MMENKTKPNKITICYEEDMKDVFDMIKSRSDDKNIIGKLSHALLREKLFEFLDEISCDLKLIDLDIRHLTKRNKCYSYNRQFKLVVELNKFGGKNEE